MTIAIAHSGVGTSEARIDPNTHGLRTVNAAGGSSTKVELRFTVRPVILLVVDADGAALELWTNVPGRPTDAELAALRIRVGSVHGRDVPLTDDLRAAAAVPLATAGWGRQGRIWQR